MAFGKRTKDELAGGWSSAADSEQPGAVAKLRGEFRRSAGSAWQPARAVFAQSSGGLPGKLVSLGELLSDASVTPAGRIVTATLALTGAWALL